MKAVFCLVFVMACAMALPVDPIVSEAKLAIRSNSDLLTFGNGLYHPVQIKEVVVPVKEVIVEEPVREILLSKGIHDVVIEVD